MARLTSEQAYKEILEMFPLDDYEQEREREGHVTMLSEEDSFDIIEGLHYCKRRYRVGDGREATVYLTTLSPDAKASLAASASPLRTIKRVKDHAAEFDKKVLFAMNASFFHFFNDGDLTPYSIQVVHGVVMAEPGHDKPQYCTYWVGRTKDGKNVISDIDGYFNTYKGNLEYAVGGGLMLIKDGEMHMHVGKARGPRSAVAFAKDGTVILLNCDGRSKASCGLSNGDMIEVVTSLGYEIQDFLNLDGGGSTTVVLREADDTLAVRNIPSGPPLPVSYSKYGVEKPDPRGEEQVRGVADCLLIVADED